MTMTEQEKQAQREARNAAICKYYLDGHKLSETSRHFKLGKQLVLRILKQAGAWRPYVKSNRTRHVGIVASEETKNALHRLAEERGTSVSALGSEILDDYVQIEKEEEDGESNQTDGSR